MTEIMMSIQPKWVEKIFNLSKRWEMRKTIPARTGPFRVLIYQTEGGGVVGEFTCCEFVGIGPGEITKRVLTDTMLTEEEALEYANGAMVYLWSIRSLIIYPEPKPLEQFGMSRPPQSWCYIVYRSIGEVSE